MAVAELTYRDALRAALVEEMDRNPDVFLIGEDIGKYKGTFRVTDGLFEKYAAEPGDWLVEPFGRVPHDGIGRRVIDTPITEPAIVGFATGAAMTGLRPVVEMMTMSFSILAIDQIINHAAKVHYMTGGQFTVPLVIRGPGGAAHQLSAQHSHSLEGWYAHVPGLKVVAPAFPADAKGLLKSAIRDDNPVIFTENPGLYGIKGEVSDDPDETVPFGKANIVREGTDVSLVAYSRMVHVCLKAAEKLESEGIQAEVVDVRSLLPLDTETIFGSISRTHRAVVVYEDWKSGGFGAEIASRIGESCFDDLDAPVLRVGGLNVPMPYARNLELKCIPNEDDVIVKVRQLL
ncbi:MAG: alpha-ketoacid dehydrogenase subunit beta [Fimbriimonadaceae bacterium]|uniref:Pyruvate dehydrogenase E1 subunit beta n=1 Tax=Candidatus Nitrosymbiomonas proteolyticus TaxID=2608984 RepID=A0A809R899_9BACT|nr:alpha-ketoacid dehydrogenase subunit beta [Fimbriimonadaceae bacterium]NUM39650.1 alpha-ketoacid dehydrogenase subunit beta [Armatimonadota bacterium]BBO23750.1 pyruvate dehydrogenase E1 subunit beta [Candidatus Nitrosymbiomonas proteolyticus]